MFLGRTLPVSYRVTFDGATLATYTLADPLQSTVDDGAGGTIMFGTHRTGSGVSGPPSVSSSSGTLVSGAGSLGGMTGILAGSGTKPPTGPLAAVEQHPITY